MKDSTFDKGFWKSFGWFLLIAALICSLPWVLAKHSWIDFTNTGEIGDTIGGIMGPFIAIAAAGLTFIAFWVQYKANIQQRHDILTERFEKKIFEMLHIQQEITNNLVVENSVNQIIIRKQGRDVFEYVYKEMKSKYTFKDCSKECTLKRALQIDDDMKLNMPVLKQLWFLDHYFRYLYRIFKSIEEAELISEVKKKEYASIVRATLSAYELVMIYYNGFSHPRFKKLIEKYAILNNLQWNLLADYDDRVDVYEEIWKEAKANHETSGSWSKEYKKSAFVS